MTTTTFSGMQSAQGSVITTYNGDYLYFLSNSTAGNAGVTNNVGGTTAFYNSSKGGTAQINNSGGVTYFSDGSTADRSKISTSADGFVDFKSASTAANATITNGNNGTTYFEGSASAGSAMINNAAGTTYLQGSSTAGKSILTNTAGGETSFDDSTKGGTAQINNSGGLTYFSGASTADHSRIATSADGFVDFRESSKAANATIINGTDGTTYFEDDASAGSATINDTAGATYFQGTSTASKASIVNTGVGFLDFVDSTNAGNATILNNASALPADGSGSGSYTDFENTSTAGNSTITSINGGRVVFYDHSTGGAARLITNGTSSVEFSLTSGLAGDGKVSAGSISGSGTYYLGADALSVGSLGLNDAVSGLIRDGGRGGGTGASLTKVGSGTLTLSGSNTYSGGTMLVGGTLDLASTSAAGTGALTFTNGAQSLAIEKGALQSNASRSFGNTINAFAMDGDVIDVRGIGTATASFNNLNGALTLTVGSQIAATLTLSGSFAGQRFQTASDGHGGTNISVGVTNPSIHSLALASGPGAGGDHVRTAAAGPVAVPRSTSPESHGASRAPGDETVQSLLTGIGSPEAAQGGADTRDGPTLAMNGHVGTAPGAFTFQSAFGHQTLQDFITGAGRSHDVLELPKGFFAENDFTTVLSANAGDAVLRGVNGSSVTLKGVSPGSLAAADLTFN